MTFVCRKDSIYIAILSLKSLDGNNPKYLKTFDRNVSLNRIESSSEDRNGLYALVFLTLITKARGYKVPEQLSEKPVVTK